MMSSLSSLVCYLFICFKQKTAYENLISDWSSDGCSSDLLYARQRKVLPGRASDEFLSAQDAMGMTPDRIPKFSELNEVLREATGWTLMGVEGLLPELD